MLYLILLIEIDEFCSIHNINIYAPGHRRTESRDSTPDELQTVLDQKNYTEELNKHLNANIEKLRKENEELKLKCHSIDTADDLAQQLQDVKKINLKLFEKLQASEIRY